MQAPSGSAAQSGSQDVEKYFDRAAGKWMYDDAASGLVYEYDDVKKAWEPTLESLQAAQAKAYSVQGVDEEAPADTVLARENKRKKGDKDQSNNKRQKKQGEPKEKRNTAIYVKGLPLDATVQEVEQEFSKAGIILGTPEPKIKLYETNGQRNGDGLIVYLQEPSADLACQLFDGAPLRYGGEPAMSVERAKFEEKAQNQGNGEGATASGSGSSARKGGRIKSDPEKAAAQKQAEKLKKKLEGWESDDEVEAKARVREAYKEHKVVILKHMFTLQELADRPEALLEIKEDVREECEALGEVTNVVLYDEEPEGIMSVRFKEERPAAACLRLMNGRHFAGMKIEAFYPDSRVKYRKSKKGDDLFQDEEEENERLEKFSKWIEEDGQKHKEMEAQQERQREGS